MHPKGPRALGLGGPWHHRAWTKPHILRSHTVHWSGWPESPSLPNHNQGKSINCYYVFLSKLAKTVLYLSMVSFRTSKLVHFCVGLSTWVGNYGSSAERRPRVWRRIWESIPNKHKCEHAHTQVRKSGVSSPHPAPKNSDYFGFL